MHSFIGAIRTLIADSGLAELMSEVLGGISKMLSGENFSKNVRAMQMFVYEQIRQVIHSLINELNYQCSVG